MPTCAETRLHGLECLTWGHDALSVTIPRNLGPRILALHLADGPNLFAEIPDFTLDCPGAGPLHLWGGHRLWVAPETARLTYLPDNRPVAITPGPDTLTIAAPVEPVTGTQKSLRLTLSDASPMLIVEHFLTNASDASMICAPWAITQLQPGGVAILPQASGPRDAEGLLPNRAVALWPYTDIGSPFIDWGNDYVLVSAELTTGALKLGWPNVAGWLAYAWRDTLFIKYAVHDPDAEYYDYGSSSQCYANARFLELETLGPRVALAPGHTLRHLEVWRITQKHGHE